MKRYVLTVVSRALLAAGVWAGTLPAGVAAAKNIYKWNNNGEDVTYELNLCAPVKEWQADLWWLLASYGAERFKQKLASTGAVTFTFPITIGSISYRTFTDPDVDLAAFKTFDFDYKGTDNPILEKELFKVVGDSLVAERGMMRNQDDPDLLITMDYFIGKKEQYVPPQTITSTRIARTWNYGYIGTTWMGTTSSVPVAKSKTIPGHTEVSYYRNITLNFLDYRKLAAGAETKTPPLVWRGEVEGSGTNSDLRVPAPFMVTALFSNFGGPDPAAAGLEHCYLLLKYSSCGVAFGAAHNAPSPDIMTVYPGSPAETAGLKPGDRLLKINGNDVKSFLGDLVCNLDGKPVSLLVETKVDGRKEKKEITLTPVVKTELVLTN